MVTAETLAQIAEKYLRIPTLESRRRDRLDFHEVAVWNIEEALRAAYEAGYTAGQNATGPDERQQWIDGSRKPGPKDPVATSQDVTAEMAAEWLEANSPVRAMADPATIRAWYGSNPSFAEWLAANGGPRDGSR